jgi:hypothetical protein
VPQAQVVLQLLKPASAPPRSFCFRFQLAEGILPRGLTYNCTHNRPCFVPSGYFFNRPCGKQMGTRFWEVMCDESGIGGSGEYCADSDAHLGRIYMFYDEALGGKYVPCAVLFDLKPGGVIGAVILSCRSASSSARTTSLAKRVGKNRARVLLTPPVL